MRAAKSKNPWRHIAALVVEERKRAGISQRELARKLGRSQQWVSRVEAGRASVELFEFIRIAHVLGFDPGRELRKISKDLS